jgi:hypothetical protein
MPELHSGVLTCAPLRQAQRDGDEKSAEISLIRVIRVLFQKRTVVVPKSKRNNGSGIAEGGDF